MKLPKQITTCYFLIIKTLRHGVFAFKKTKNKFANKDAFQTELMDV
ncbi:MAG: hypothetical protein PWR04_1792 [Anaerophaga sp.]|nr:hypothetical protein [Anaerophaga sp.]